MPRGVIVAVDDGPTSGERLWAHAGTSAKGEYHCVSCGYGVVVHTKLPRCPMCGGESWRPALWSPFSRALRD